MQPENNKDKREQQATEPRSVVKGSKPGPTSSPRPKKSRIAEVTDKRSFIITWPGPVPKPEKTSSVQPLQDVDLDLKASASEPDYTAVNTLWLALLKLANLEKGKSERARMVTLVNRIPEANVRAILSAEAVDWLLNLEPPLETITSSPHEELRTNKVSEALKKLRDLRISSPKAALVSLGILLKEIRNKREHGFKTRVGPRDIEILRAARSILDKLCGDAYKALSESAEE